jgi:molybdopterin synthase sulfur carrier subunit
MASVASRRAFVWLISSKAVEHTSIRLLFFSVLQDITGVAEEQLQLPGQTHSVSDLLSLLYQRWPDLERWDSSLLVAVDQAYAKRTDMIPLGAEVAIFPPVQGG